MFFNLARDQLLSSTFSHLLSLPASHWWSHSQSWWLGSWDCCPSKKPRLIQAARRNCKLSCSSAVSICTELTELYNSHPAREQEEDELWSSQEQVNSPFLVVFHHWHHKNYQLKTRGSKNVGWKSIHQNPGIPECKCSRNFSMTEQKCHLPPKHTMKNV